MAAGKITVSKCNKWGSGMPAKRLDPAAIISHPLTPKIRSANMPAFPWQRRIMPGPIIRIERIGTKAAPNATLD
jgi:hypothetical protein